VLRAVFVRTLKPSVTYEQFHDAWAAQDAPSAHSARVEVSRNVADDRQVLTTVELDVPVEEFAAATTALTHPDALKRLAEIVERTDLEGLYEDLPGEPSG